MKAARKQFSSTSAADNQGNSRPKTTVAKTSKKVAFRVPSPSSDEDETPSKSRQSRAQPQARVGQVDATLRRVNTRQGQNGRTSIYHSRDLLEDRLTRSTQHCYLLTAERILWSSRHSRKEFIQDGAVRKSVSRNAAGRSRQGQVQPDLVGSRPERARHNKTHLVGGHFVSPGMDSSSEDDSLSESERPIEETLGPPKGGPFKAARKFQFGVKSGRRPANPIHEAEMPDTLHQAEEHNITIYDDSDISMHDSAVDDAEQDDVTERAPERTAPRPPFLLRNLRAGFKSRCRSIGVNPLKKEPLLHPVSVSYPRQLGSIEEQQKTANGVIETRVHSWMCSLCNLHGQFNNHTILDMHLRWDHPEVKATWDATYSTLSLVIPILEKTPSAPINPEPQPASTNANVGPKTRLQVAEKPPIRISSSPGSAATSESSPAPSATPIAEDTKPKIEPLSDRATPRAVDNFGPAAAFPYLPESADGSMYSCRPGGPRIYDMLNTLSLEPFGVLSWLIVDREEELFELDDVLDEDKVMLALWNRWIFLNRNKFMANYFNGTKAFVKENWKMIHQAAGLTALRTWLLVLCVNNFLPPLEVVSIIQFYQALTSKNST